MRLVSVAFLASASLLVCSSPAFAGNPHIHHGPTSPRLIRSRTSKPTVHAVSSIAPERAAAIQSALIKAGYLTGTPSGVWDGESQAAMQKLQGDNGWQTRLVPDARAIIKLGLGPGSTAMAEAETAQAPAAPANAAETFPVPTNQ